MNGRAGKSRVEELLSAIKDEIQSVQDKGKDTDEKVLATLSFEIGRVLQSDGVGHSEIVALSDALQREFSGLMDFSERSLAGMARFFRLYGEHEVLNTLINAVSWPKHLAILERCDTDRAQEFYIRMARKFEWSESVLVQKIEDFRPPS